jgi:phosphoserine phosphatase
MIRLVAFDVDGTLLRGPTVCQVLAGSLGRQARMDALELVTERHEVRAAREEMASWYRRHPMVRLQAYLDGVVLAPGVHEGFGLLKRHNIEIALVSLTWQFAVAWLAERLGADVAIGTGLSPAGRIDHVWAEDKATRLAELARARRITLGEVAAVGDSGGDVHMLELVGLRVFVGRSVPAGLSDVVHMPDGDIGDVARRIVDHGRT